MAYLSAPASSDHLHSLARCHTPPALIFSFLAPRISGLSLALSFLLSAAAGKVNFGDPILPFSPAQGGTSPDSLLLAPFYPGMPCQCSPSSAPQTRRNFQGHRGHLLKGRKSHSRCFSEGLMVIFVGEPLNKMSKVSLYLMSGWTPFLSEINPSLGMNLSSAILTLCDLGQMTQPLWASCPHL